MESFQKLGRMPIVLTVPAFAILLLVFGKPIVTLFLASLNAPAFSIANYKAFFENPAYVRVLLQTIEISGVATAVCLFIGYPTAYLITSASKRWRMMLIVLVFIPYLTSGLVRTYAWVVILGDRGLINNLLTNLGLVSSPLPLIYNRMAVYIGMVHIMLPMMILPLISVMLRIDKSLMSAARSMGARPFAAFWRVFFPLTLPGVRSGVLLVFVICLGFYITPQALGGVRDAMLSTFIAAQIESTVDLNSVAASAFILLGVAAVVLSVFGLDISGKQVLAGQPARRSSRLPSPGTVIRYLNEIAIPRRARRWTAQLYHVGGLSRWPKIAGSVFVMLVVFYLLFPGVIVIVMSFSGGAFLEFPPSHPSLQWYRSFFNDPSWTGAFWDSVQIGFMVTIISTVVGTLAAYGLNRTYPKLRVSLTMVMLAPITVPVIVVGVAIYLGLINLGLIGSKFGIVLAHSIGAMSLIVVIVSASLANFDRSLEQAAKSMRAGPIQTFMRVTLPLIRPGVIGGALLAFIHSFDEVVVTSLVSGFSIRTLPLKMWEDMRHQMDPTIAAVASIFMLLPVVWLIILYTMWWRARSTAQQEIPTFGT